jgi:hypothetical protein
MSALTIPPQINQSKNEGRDIRVEDYLNDKLQTYTDLENLDSLLVNVKQQQDLLRQQVHSQ